MLAPRAARRGDVVLHHRRQHLHPGPDRQGQQPLAQLAGQLGQRHAHPLRHGRAGSSRSRCSGSSCARRSPSSWCSWRFTRCLPRGGLQAGDRHLKFHEFRDNLPVSTAMVLSEINWALRYQTASALRLQVRSARARSLGALGGGGRRRSTTPSTWRSCSAGCRRPRVSSSPFCATRRVDRDDDRYFGEHPVKFDLERLDEVGDETDVDDYGRLLGEMVFVNSTRATLARVLDASRISAAAPADRRRRARPAALPRDPVGDALLARLRAAADHEREHQVQPVPTRRPGHPAGGTRPHGHR